MKYTEFTCASCGEAGRQSNGAVNRARNIGAPLYCNRICAGVGRRKNKSIEQKRAEKAAYDREYRAANLEKILAQKREYFQRTYDPVAAAVYRKSRMPIHVEYCRSAKYKAYKHQYDLRHRMQKDYGPFWEAARVLVDLQRLIRERANDVDIRTSNGTLNKTQKRKKEYAQAAQDHSRPRRRRTVGA